MKKLAGLLLLIVGLTLTIGAGANFRYYEAERSVTVNITSDDNEFIDLTPLQPYAYLNNGKLTIEISPNNPNYPGYGDGMSVNTTYVFEEMFNVSNELWENEDADFPICVRISLNQGDGISFFAGDYDSPISGPGTQIHFTVYHNQPVPVGFIFDNTNKDLGSNGAQMSVSADAGACE
jgi:hypothetical protein